MDDQRRDSIPMDMVGDTIDDKWRSAPSLKSEVASSGQTTINNSNDWLCSRSWERRPGFRANVRRRNLDSSYGINSI
ncbi:hypothetical protein X773_33045 [Mesorhizobium sp. LSJC285A00]|nr:hypothetical protein X773_33045 [Mesorhizobium sp. LSJC285A00]